MSAVPQTRWVTPYPVHLVDQKRQAGPSARKEALFDQLMARGPRMRDVLRLAGWSVERAELLGRTALLDVALEGFDAVRHVPIKEKK